VKWDGMLLVDERRGAVVGCRRYVEEVDNSCVIDQEAPSSS
jgi:hypothetical protein